VKKLVFLFSLIFCFFLFASDTQASLVKIDKNGEVIWQVLSSEDSLALGIAERGKIEVKDIAGDSAATNIALKREGDKLFLNVTTWEDSLVEIEERGDVKKVTIGKEGDKFTIEQNGVVAITDFPIIIRPRENELSVTTESGSVFLSVLPIEAAESALRSRFLSQIPEKKMFLVENESGTLAYKISGEKVLNILNMIEYPIPVVADVSVSNGEILAIEGPEWFRIFGFLFS
jgi:hypothetical protein